MSCMNFVQLSLTCFIEPLIIDFFSSCHLVSVFSIVSSLEEAFKSAPYFFIEMLKGVFKGNCHQMYPTKAVNTGFV